MNNDDNKPHHRPGLGTAAIVGGGALLAVLLSRRGSPPRNGSRPLLGSFGAELAVQWFEDAATSTTLRNRGTPDRLTYRPVGAAGERYPAWVRELRGKSGVYVIRDRASGEALYVGQSISDKLYETMTRHLQRWRRWKSWFVGQYVASENDPGVTYDRDRVEVAARVLSPVRALEEEVRLIRALKPRDNINLVDAKPPEDIPF